MIRNIYPPGMKTILMLHSSSDIYGASKILYITAKLLHEKGHKIYVAISEDGPLVKLLQDAGITVIICRLGILRRKYFSVKGMLNRAQVLLKARKVLSEIVKQHRVDVIYSNTTGVLVGAFVAKQCKVKHIWHIHEIIENPPLFSKLIGKLVNRYSDMVITVSGEVQKYWTKHITGNKMITIYNGLDYTPYLTSSSSIREELDIKDDEVLIGMVGRVNTWKGQKYFIQMASVLAKRFTNVKFLLAGDAYPGYEYLQQELQEIIKHEDLGCVVIDLGFRSDIPNILKGLDIFVLPSILPDPLPTVVLESMASSKPVIATQHGGALEMVANEQTGILIPWNEAETAVERFAYLINDATARKKMGDAGMNRVLDMFSKQMYETNILNVINAI